MEAITLHTTKMAERKESMQKNLDYASQFGKQAADTKLDQHTRDKAQDQIAHFGREAAEDEKLLKIMQEDKQKMLKSYNFLTGSIVILKAAQNRLQIQLAGCAISFRLLIHGEKQRLVPLLC